MPNFVKHIPHYVSLLSIFGAGLIGFYVFSYDKYFIMAIAVSLTLAYVSWGIVHHGAHKDLCWSVIFEYLALGVLGLVLILSLIYRS